jgi:hypothetical protein
MPRAKCVQNVTFGATGDVYKAGENYDVPAATLQRYGEYFKVRKTTANKQAETEENK